MSLSQVTLPRRRLSKGFAQMGDKKGGFTGIRPAEHVHGVDRGHGSFRWLGIWEEWHQPSGDEHLAHEPTRQMHNTYSGDRGLEESIGIVRSQAAPHR